MLHFITCHCRSSKGKCLGPFDTNFDGRLSRGEFSELCYELFVGTGDEVNYGVYEFDPDAIFGRIAGIMSRRWSDRRTDGERGGEKWSRRWKEIFPKSIDRPIRPAAPALNCPKR